MLDQEVVVAYKSVTSVYILEQASGQARDKRTLCNLAISQRLIRYHVTVQEVILQGGGGMGGGAEFLNSDKVDGEEYTPHPLSTGGGFSFSHFWARNPGHPPYTPEQWNTNPPPNF
eukprot:gene22499-1334_t